jgi:hypothetical protein
VVVCRTASFNGLDHQQIVTVGGGNLDGALGAFLAFDVLQIEPRHRRGGKPPMRGTNR